MNKYNQYQAVCIFSYGNDYCQAEGYDGFDIEQQTCVNCSESTPFNVIEGKCINCSEYTLDTCPANAVCSSCGGNYKLDSCNSGYAVSGNSCVAYL
ncbi:MAG: hypothetical protein IJ660_06590, partial [Alphaproteobacteria bacterium]|nr:hypothetical protein [Alphaproteobacteria bacterium]